MNKRAVLLGISLCLVAGPVLAQDNLMKQAQSLFKPIPAQPPASKDNPLAPAKVELGKMLYFDPRLSESHAVSCNSCHMVGLGGVDVQETSIGHRWQRGSRNAPTVLNALFNTAQFWDGRAKDLNEQAGGPLINPIDTNLIKVCEFQRVEDEPEAGERSHDRWGQCTDERIHYRA